MRRTCQFELLLASMSQLVVSPGARCAVGDHTARLGQVVVTSGARVAGWQVAEEIRQLHTGTDIEFGEGGPEVRVDRIR